MSWRTRYTSRAVHDFPSVRLILVRHAQARNAAGTSYDDASLSPLGESQRAAVGGAIAARRPDVLYTSPAPRARQTAASIEAAARLEMSMDERLLEYRYGSIADPGLTLEQLRERRDDLRVWKPHHKLAGDGETLREFAARVAAALDEIVVRHLAETVVIVAHAGTVDAAARWAMGMDPDTWWVHDFPIANATITELIYWPRGRVDGGAPRYTEFVSIGSTHHLPAGIRSGN